MFEHTRGPTMSLWTLMNRYHPLTVSEISSQIGVTPKFGGIDDMYLMGSRAAQVRRVFKQIFGADEQSFASTFLEIRLADYSAPRPREPFFHVFCQFAGNYKEYRYYSKDPTIRPEDFVVVNAPSSGPTIVQVTRIEEGTFLNPFTKEVIALLKSPKGIKLSW